MFRNLWNAFSRPYVGFLLGMSDVHRNFIQSFYVNRDYYSLGGIILLDMARKGTIGLRVDFFPTCGSSTSNRRGGGGGGGGEDLIYLDLVEAEVARGHFHISGHQNIHHVYS